MAEPAAPPFVARALDALAGSCAAAGVALDVTRTPFAALAPVVAGLAAADARTRGAWALGLAALFGAKAAAHGAFWFPQRELAAGAALGFPHALVVVDPVPLVEDALAAGDVAALDRRLEELGHALAGAGRSDAALTVEHYRDLFDPGFAQFLVIDTAAVERSLALTPAEAAAELRAGLAAAALDPAVASTLDSSWLRPLLRLDDAPLSSQTRERRAVERFVALSSTVSAGAPADEGFWADVALRLLGHASPAAAEASQARLFGVFRLDAVRPLFGGPGAPGPHAARVLLVDAADVKPALAGAALDAKPRGDLLDVAYERLRELRALVDAVGSRRTLALRRLTAAEAADEAAAVRVREALRGAR